METPPQLAKNALLQADWHDLPQCFYRDEIRKVVPVTASDCLPLIEQIRDWVKELEKGEQVTLFSCEEGKGFKVPVKVVWGTCALSIILDRHTEEEEGKFSEMATRVEQLMDKCVRGGYAERYGGWIVAGKNKRLVVSISGRKPEDEEREYFNVSQVPSSAGTSSRRPKKPEAKGREKNDGSQVPSSAGTSSRRQNKLGGKGKKKNHGSQIPSSEGTSSRRQKPSRRVWIASTMELSH